jgi:hypothetical protein
MPRGANIGEAITAVTSAGTAAIAVAGDGTLFIARPRGTTRPIREGMATPGMSAIPVMLNTGPIRGITGHIPRGTFTIRVTRHTGDTREAAYR